MQLLRCVVLGGIQAEEAVTAKNFPKGAGQARSRQDRVGGLRSMAVGPMGFLVSLEGSSIGDAKEKAVDSVALARLGKDAVSRDVGTESPPNASRRTS